MKKRVFGKAAGVFRFVLFAALVMALVVGCHEQQPVEPPGFELALQPGSLRVAPGESAELTLTLTPLNGFSGTVELSLEGLDGAAAPEGIGLSPASVEVAGTEAVEQPLTLTVAESVEPGSYELRVVARAGEIEQAADLYLEVAVAPGFGMTLEPEELSVVQGSSGQTVLTVTPLNGFSGTVELSLEGLDGASAPEGIGLSPANVEVAGNEAVEQPLTLTVAESVEPGSYELRVRGTSGQLSSTAALRLEVLREVPPVAQLTASPNSGEAPLFVGFDIEAYDPDGGEVTCTLDFGDETPPASSCSGYTHTYTEGGSYTAELKVRDDEGHEVTATAVVEVGSQECELGVEDVREWTAARGMLYNVTYGDNLYITVGEGGTILTSSDGYSWERADSGTRDWLGDVTHGGNLYIVVGEKGIILTSANGQSWERTGSGSDVVLRGVTYGDEMYVTVGDEGAILTSYDGYSWERVDSGTEARLYDITYGDGLYVAVGDEGTILISADGYSWERVDSGTDAILRGITYGDGLYVTVSSGNTILISNDGQDWEQVDPGIGGSYVKIYNVIYNNGLYIATSGYHYYNYNYRGLVLISTDGRTWEKVHSETTGAVLHGITYGNGLYIAVGAGSSILTSTDGRTWEKVNSGTGTLLFDVTYGDGLYVAVGRYGASLTSSDGQNWEKVDSGSGAWLFDVTYGDGLYVAVGDDGTILTSTDGQNWETVESGTGAWLAGVTYGDGLYVAVGDGGIVLTSADGYNWETVYTDKISANVLYGVTYGDGLYVAVGEGYDGADFFNYVFIVISRDGYNWERIEFATEEYQPWAWDVTYGNGLFVAVGFERAYISSNGYDWEEIYFDPDLNIRYYDEGINGIVYANGTFVAVGEYGAILTSTDGYSWERADSGTGAYLLGVAYGDCEFVAVGSLGIILIAP